ncbi:two-component system regulatory protein YycI [Aquisalibacillus elongatus]|uniref:Regulatory protein YycI of two-component signal transduction system YycFG n=1 Tax=Aquisalibacillus elongatus TaxID=485577 RepID=A0A3N5BZ20_9BACI|nr:two-component system regulatory protein YycI [Aquisalibacillus elongatus]RPF51105.1 regulatory protein YycI of two-component signal transduction system YycFG [Aquisalibacillus elongatus]
MKWGQIKTIFIISFLVLNLFLLQELLNKVERSEYDTLDKSTLEDQLAAQEIEYSLPESGQTEAYVSAERYQLTEDDMDDLGDLLDEQTIEVGENQEVIVSEFNEPLELDFENREEAISLIKEQVLYGDQYSFWDYYEEENVLLFFQKQNDRMVYFNETSSLIVQLDEEGRAIQYRQTLLEEVEHRTEEQETIDPINVIRTLYSSDFIMPESAVSMKMGYQRLVPLEDGVQVFVPTWEVIVNDDEHYFVNAIEGQHIPNDELDFVIGLKESLKREIDELEINRSETE